MVTRSVQNAMMRIAAQPGTLLLTAWIIWPPTIAFAADQPMQARIFRMATAKR
jgi:hypothetical protein